MNAVKNWYELVPPLYRRLSEVKTFLGQEKYANAVLLLNFPIKIHQTLNKDFDTTDKKVLIHNLDLVIQESKLLLNAENCLDESYPFVRITEIIDDLAVLKQSLNLE